MGCASLLQAALAASLCQPADASMPCTFEGVHGLVAWMWALPYGAARGRLACD